MVKTLEGCILEGWATAKTKNGVYYYLNHSRGVTQWDHPEYIKMMEEIQIVNSVRYSAYRTACKLRRLQTKLKLHEVSLQCVMSAFDNAGLKVAENSDFVSVTQLEPIILQVLRSTHRHKIIDLNLCAELTTNLLLNVYDPTRTGNVQVLSCKVLMVVLCGGRLQEKYRYLFTQLADHNNCCTRRKLGQLLRDLAKIPEVLSEQPSFGVRLVSAAVNSCFTEIGNEVGITEEGLLSWLLQEPQTLVWWTTLYRLSSAELVCHDIKCGVCKQRPVIGLRYQCLRCLGYNLCQDCFLHARISRGHKLNHPILEYCHETSNKEKRKSLLKMLQFKFKRNNNKQRYLSISTEPNADLHLTSLLDDGGGGGGKQNWGNPPAQSDRESSTGEEGDDEAESAEVELQSRTILLPEDDCESQDDCHDTRNDECDKNGVVMRRTRNGSGGKEPTIIPATPRHRIHSVIMHLQEGHQQLWDGLEQDKESHRVSQDVVEQHTLQLQTQINKLKDILQSYSALKKGGKQSNRAACLESTPITGDRGMFLNLSPIPTIGQSLDDTAVLDNKENHLVENPLTPNKGTSVHRPIRSPYTPRQRMVLAPLTPTIDEVDHKSPTDSGKLQSYTEINFSDLTRSTTCQNSSRDKKSNKAENKYEICSSDVETPNKKERPSSLEVAEVKEELEHILKQLDDIFPLAAAEGIIDSPDSGNVMEAAYELGDVLANYVNIIPEN